MRVMSVSSQQHASYQENRRFLSRSYTSKEKFISEYKRLYYKNRRAKELYLLVLIELKKAISDGNIDSLKKLSNFIDYINSIEDQIILKDYYNSSDNPIKNTNLVILSCEHNKLKMLKYLFDNDSKLLNNLSVDIGNSIVLPNDENEACHNAFYYAIRSGNVGLLNTLINKWPGNYFVFHLEEMDGILSIAYEELKLKNVPLSEEIEIFVENTLIGLRFFSNTCEQYQSFRNNAINIRERIELVLENISLLKAEYSNTGKVDGKFLFIAKFIAQNIHILKQQLKSSYNRLPWEEMEFCLVSFVVSFTKQQEINVVYRATLNKDKILKYLENFARRLEDEKDNIEGMDINKFTDLSKLKHDEVVTKIISNYPEFEELFNDYRHIKDTYSLKRMSNYIQLTLLADPEKKEEQLIITRGIQVIGECLKDTVESSNLSSTTSELLLLSFPNNIRNVIIDLRNSLSHAYSFFMTEEIEENADTNLFANIQNDIKKIGAVINELLYDKMLTTIEVLLKTILGTKDSDKIKETADILYNIPIFEMVVKGINPIATQEEETIEELIKELKSKIHYKTDDDKKIFDAIDNIIISKKFNRVGFYGNHTLENMNFVFKNKRLDNNDIGAIRNFVDNILNNIKLKVGSKSLKNIAYLVMKISKRFELTEQDDEIGNILTKIYCIAELDTRKIEWIEELKTKIHGDTGRDTIKDQNNKLNAKQNYQKELDQKLSMLKSILNKYGLNDQLTGKISFYKKNKKLQSAVEMLVLDIMLILDSSTNILGNNLLLLDDNTPLLTGRCLCNYLVHDNALMDVLLSDPSIAVILNAKKLTVGNITKDKKKIGKLVRDDPSKLKDRYNRDLDIINNQERMFIALEEGNLEDLKRCIKNGTDINARSINMWSTLHYAAKGSNLEIVKFLLDHNLNIDVKDIDNKNPLHIAASFGSYRIVQFFVEDKGMDVNCIDNQGKTPLLIAAENGHKNVVKFLLSSNADISIRDINGFTPLHCAVKNGHRDVVKMLLEKEADVDNNKARGDFTLLHIASRNNRLELVKFLLANKANVDAMAYNGWTPLHYVAQSGEKCITDVLIKEGAYVNAKTIHGETPLHLAAEYGNVDVIKVLLNSGVDINAKSDMYGDMPLHSAARRGYKDVVKILLDKGADANGKNEDNNTPLHAAASHNDNKEVVEVLIQGGANMNAKAKDGYTPLHFAAVNGYVEITKVLIRKDANINIKTDDDRTPIQLAVWHHQPQIVKILLQHKNTNVNVRNCNDVTLLHIAAYVGNLEIVKCIIEKGADINAKCAQNCTPLHLAAGSGHKEVTTLLLDKGADVNSKSAKGCTPLYYAAEQDHKKIIDVLIKKGACVDAKNETNVTPLYLSIQHGNLKAFEILSSKGADINTKIFNNMTPLHIAASNGYRKLVELLIKKGADFDATDKDNITPLHLAASKGHNNVVEVLLKSGANITVTNNQNATPLELAILYDHLQVVRILLHDKRVNINVKNNNGYTALHIATLMGKLEMVKYLIEEGADINVQTNEGSTPLHLAVAKGHKEIIEFLRVKADLNIQDHENKTAEPLQLDVDCFNQYESDSLKFAVVTNTDELEAKKWLKKMLVIQEKCYGVDHLKVAQTLIYLSRVDRNSRKAKKLIERALGIQENHYGPESPEVAKTLVYLSVVYGRFGNSKKQKEFLKRALNIQRRHYGTDHFKVAATLINLSVAYGNLGNTPRMKELLDTALSITEKHNGTDRLEIAILLLNLGSAYGASGDFQEEEELLEKALGIKERYCSSNCISIPSTINNFNAAYLHSDVLYNAKDLLEQTLTIKEKHYGIDHFTHATTLMNLSLIYGNLGYNNKKKQLLERALKIQKKHYGCENLKLAETLAGLWTVYGTSYDFQTQKELGQMALLPAEQQYGCNNTAITAPHINLADTYLNLEDYQKAENLLEQALEIQEKHYGSGHFEVVATTKKLFHVYTQLDDVRKQNQVREKASSVSKKSLGSNCLNLIATHVQMVDERLKIQPSEMLNIGQQHQKAINIAASNDNIRTVQHIDERTTSHHAADNGNMDITSSLLKNGVDVTQVTNEANTPLHIATSKGQRKVAEILSQNVSRDEANDYINATTISGDTTLPHVVAKDEFMEIVKSLFKHDTSYNIENKERRIPLDLNKDEDVNNMLKLVNELFEDAKNGNGEITNKLRALTPDQFVEVTNTRNNQGNTLLQVAIVSGHTNIVSKLLKLLEVPDPSQSPHCLKIEESQLEKFKRAAEVHLHFSELYSTILQDILLPCDSDVNPSPWKTLKEFSYYLGNAYDLVQVYKDTIPGLIYNENIQTVNNMLTALEFKREHISSGYTDEAYGGQAECFVSKGQGTLYYKLLHSESRKDVRLFRELVEINIDNPVRRFLESIKNRVRSPLSEKLFDAIVNSNLQEVEDCIKKGVVVNSVDTDGRTSLHHAVNNGNIDIVNTLLKNGADATQVTNEGYTPLHIATSEGHWEIVEVLLQHVSRDELKDCINAKTTSGGTTSLHVAAKSGSLEIVKSLLKHGAIYNIENKECRIPLDLSEDEDVNNVLKLVSELFEDAKNGNDEIINKLRALTPDEFVTVTSTRNNQGNTLLQVAIVSGHTNIVSKLLKLLEVPDPSQSPHCLKIEEGQLEKFKRAAEVHLHFTELYSTILQDILLPCDSDVNPSPWKTLKEFSYYLGNAYDLVQVYKDTIPGLIYNENIQTVNNMLTALEFKREHISSGYTDEANGGQAECFVSKGQGTLYYKLLHSESRKDVRLFRELVEINIDNPVRRFLESIKNRVRSPLSEKLFDAIVNSNLQEVEDCIKKGVVVNSVDTDGRTSLHHAVNNGNIDIVNTLLKNGADATQVTNKGNTPLHIATSKGHWKVVEILLQHVSRDELNDYIDAKTTSGGTTSLHVAAKRGSLEIVKNLLKHGAIYNIENKECRIPLDLSKDEDVNKMLKLVNKLFEDAKNGNDEIINKLRALAPDQFVAVTNTRNNQGNTLLQVAIVSGHTNIVSKLLKLLEVPDPSQSPHCLKIEQHQLESLKSAAEMHLHFSELYSTMLQGILLPCDSDVNPSPWKTLKEFSYYLGNAYNLVQVYRDTIPGLIYNENIQTVNNMLTALEFKREHISKGYTDEAYGGQAECFVSKGQGTLYYKLLHSESRKDVRLFRELVEINIDNPVRRFLESIKQRLESVFSKMLLDAIAIGNQLEVENSIKKGAVVNLEDTDGRTSLHYAVHAGNIDVVNTLLKNGANVTQVTNNGNTPLHIATSKGHWKVVEILLQHVSRDELNDYIDAKTTSGGTTSLHVAAKRGSLEIVKNLLKHGAIYNIENKECRIPLDLSKDEDVNNMLKLVNKLFEDAKNGNDEIINKLRALAPDQFVAVTNTRNNQGNTLLQVAIVSGHTNIVSKLLKLLVVSGPSQSSHCHKIEEHQLESLKSAAEVHLHFSELYSGMLPDAFLSCDSDENPSPWKTLKEFSYYLGNAYRLVQVCKDTIPGLIYNENIQTVNNMLTALEFKREHISKGYTDEAYGGQAKCFVSKGQGTLYYKLSHSESRKDVRLFREMVELNIDTPVRRFLESIKNRVRSPLSEKLFDAIVNSNLQEVEDCIKKGVVVNSVDTDGRTSLHHAVNNGNIDIVNTLLKNGADATQVTNEGYTPLHIATSEGHWEIVEVLLQHVSRDELKDCINAKTTSGGTTSLHVAAKSGSLEIVKSLLKHGAIYNIENKECRIPLDLSEDEDVNNMLKLVSELFEDAKNGNDEIINKLRALTPDEFVTVTSTRSNQGNTLFQVAIVSGHKNIVSKLLKLLEVPDPSQSPHCLKIEQHQLESLKSAAEVHLHFSELYSNMFVGILLPRDSDVNPSPWKTLKEFSYYLGNAYRLVHVCKDTIPGLIYDENIQTVKNMLTVLEFKREHISKGYADEAQGGQTECFVSKGQGTLYYKLSHSESRKDVRLLREMVELNIDTPVRRFLESIKQRLQSIFSKKLLDAVAIGNQLEVESCIKKGAAVNFEDTEGRTSLHYAVHTGNIDIINTLLKNGADVTQVTNNGNTPLHIATSKGHWKIVEILLQHVSRDKLNDCINAKTTSGGTTSLHVAAKSGSLEIVKSLLKHGASYNIENKECRIPLDLSEDEGVNNILKLVNELFEDAKNGNGEIINKLRALTPDQFVIVTNTRNNQRNTLLQVAIVSGHTNIVSKLYELFKEPHPIQSLSCLKIEGDQLEKLKSAAEWHIRFNELYLLVLEIMLPNDIEKNHSPWSTLRTGFSYLRNVYRLIELSKDNIPGLINNENIQGVRNMLIALEFIPEHSTTGNIDVENGGQENYIICKDSLYYRLLISESRKDVMLFIEIVEIHINNPLKWFLLSIKQRLQSVLSEKLFEAIVNDNPVEVENYIKKGVVINLENTDGRTSLHNAVDNGNMEIVNTLLKYGADVTQITNEGNTLLHIATSKGHWRVVEVLLEHASRDELNDYVNAKTIFESNTSLHIATKNGSLEIVQSLLKHGAIYNIENNACRIPLDFSKDQHVTNLLKLIEELFEDAKNGNEEITNKLRAVTPDKFVAVTNARNELGDTLLQVAIINGHKNIADQLLEMLKGLDPIQSRPSHETELDQLKKIESAAELHIRFSELHFPMLQCTLQPCDSETNPSPWETLKAGSYYLRNAYRLVEVCKHNIPDLLYDENIQTVNNMLTVLEFNPGHITKGYSDEAFGGLTVCFVSKGQGTLYYKLLHSESRKDVRQFRELVEINIDNPVRRFLESIKQRLQSVFSKMLLDAIAIGNQLEVENCIKKGAVVNLEDTNGRTSLHHAIHNGNIDIVNTLLKYGADVTQVTNKGNTPLHIAASKGHWEVVEVLLQHVSRDELKDYVNAKMISGGTTSLHIAAKNGSLEIVKSLLKHGATYNMENKECRIPLDFSKDQHVTNLLKLIEELFEDAKNGNEEIISKLRAVTPDEFVAVTKTRNNQGNTLLQVAIVNGHKNIADKLLEVLKRPDPIQSQSSYETEFDQLKKLASAAELHIRFSELNLPILLSTSRPNDFETNPSPWESLKAGSYYLRNAYRLVEVCKNNIPDMLYDENIETVNNMLTVLEFNPEHITKEYSDEAFGGQAECFLFKGQGTLYYKLLHNKSKKALKLFREMVEINIDAPVRRFLESIKQSVQSFFSDKLFEAILINNRLEVENCIKRGAAVNLEDSNGRTSLHHAIHKGNVDIVNVLLRNGADITQVTNKGNTPLHIATFKGHWKVVEALLQHVSRDELNDYVNAKTTFGGNTSLHIAAKNGCLKIVKSLLKHGATYNIENKECRNPLDLCIYQNIIKILKLIGELFEDARNGNAIIINKLKAVTPDEFAAVMNTRNEQGNTLLQVAIVKGHMNIAGMLLKMLKKSDPIQSGPSELEQLKKIESASKEYLRSRDFYMKLLHSLVGPSDSERNSLPWLTLEHGSLYLKCTYCFIVVCLSHIPSLKDDENIVALANAMMALNFYPADISKGFANGIPIHIYLTNRSYLELLQSRSKKDVRTFIELVKNTIDVPLNRFLQSIKQRLQVAK